MKRILTILALMWAMKTEAQIPAKIDTTAQMWYCNITPIPITADNDSINIRRVYIYPDGRGCWQWYSWLHFGMYYQETSTGRWVQWQGWTRQINYNSVIINPVQSAFTYMRDSFLVEGVQPYIINYIP